MGEKRFILPVIFFASLSALAYEIILTRIFSISLWYHFAFMVVSIAMLGIAASGTLLSVYPRLKDLRYMEVYLLIFSISMAAAYLLMNSIPFDPAKLSWDRAQLLYISLYYLSLSFPFFSFGLIVATALSVMNKSIGQIYGADLTGAGAGSLLILWLLSTAGPDRIVFLLSSISAVSLLFFGRGKVRFFAFLLLIIASAVFYTQPSFINLRISPYKPLETALRYPGSAHLRTYWSPFSRVDIFRSPAIRYAPGLSLIYLEDLPAQIGIAVDAGDIYAVTDNGDRKDLDFLRYLPSSLPYELSHHDKVLLLEPMGGLPVLTAKYYGSVNIYRIDSNPLVVKSVREYLSSFSAGIYENNTWTGIGRSLPGSFSGLDLIDISMTGSAPSGSFGFSEDYRFTVEAFEEYLDRLGPKGLLAVNLFIIPPPRMELRLLNTFAEVLRRQGIKVLAHHVAVIRSWDTITMILKKSELTQRDIDKIKKFAASRRFDLIYYPGIREEETNIFIKTPSNEYFRIFQNLIFPETRRRITADYLFDIGPVHDEDPFFNYYLKIRNVREIYRLMGGKWQYFIEEGYLLPVIFVQVFILSVMLIILPSLKSGPKSRLDSSPSLIPSLAYFAVLGTGYMFIEISFIQKMILPLENPSYAVSVVLSSMLISSGTGSLLSQRYENVRRMETLLVLCLVIFLYSLFLPTIMAVISPYPLPAKLVSVFFILMPAGMFMGIPFPLGLSFLGRRNPSLITWAWAVNGCLSVISPILAVMLAISAGFKTVLISGVMMYLLAFLFMKLMKYERV